MHKKLKEIQESEIKQQKENDFLSKFTQRKQNCQGIKQTYNNSLIELDSFFREKEWKNFSSFSSDVWDEYDTYSEEDVEANNEAFIPVHTNSSQSWDGDTEQTNIKPEKEVTYRQTNIIFEFVNTRAGNVTNLQPKPEIKAIRPEDNKKVEKAQAILDQVWDQQDGNRHLTHSIWLSKWKPIVFTYLPWDGSISNIPSNDVTEPTKGDFRLEHLDASHVWWDPSANRIQDMTYIILAWKMTQDSLKAYFRTDDEIREKLTDDFFEDMKAPVISKEDAGDIYVTPENVETSIEDEYVLNIYFEKHISEEGDIRISCTYLLNDTIILKKIKDIGIKKFPLASLKEFNIPDSFYGLSTAALTLPAQKTLTSLEKKEANIYRTKGKELILLAGELDMNKDEVLDFLLQESGDAIGVQVVAKQTRTGQPLSNKVGKINVGEAELQSLQNSQALTIQMAKRQVGITDAYEGNSVGSVQTAGGVKEILSRSSNIDAEATNNINIYLEDMFDIIVEYLKHNYTPRVFNFDTERTTAQGSRYPEDIFQDGSFDNGQSEMPAMAEGPGQLAGMAGMGGMDPMAAMGGMDPMASIGGGQDPMAGLAAAMGGGQGPMAAMGGGEMGQPPMGGMGQGPAGIDQILATMNPNQQPGLDLNQQAQQQQIPENPMDSILGGVPKDLNTPNRFKTLELEGMGDGNELSESEFKVDVDIYNQTATEKTQNNQIMGQWIDRIAQQNNNMIDSDLAKAYFEQIHLPSAFINKAYASMKKTEQQKQQQEQQAQAMQQQQELMKQQQAQDTNQNQLVMSMMNKMMPQQGAGQGAPQGAAPQSPKPKPR